MTAVGKITILSLQQMKRERRPIVALTSYDYTTTKLLNEAGADLLLVGDTLGMVKLGYSSTLPVTVDDMVYHTRVVARANTRALLVTDMPYLSYQASKEEAVRNCGRMLKVGAEAVKLEGGKTMAPVIRALRGAGIPVLGHIGMTPQSVHLFGGYRVQGRRAADHRRLLADARALQNAGVFAIVLECVPRLLARRITRAVKVPTIGIGAGPDCDGQILVIDDLLGLTPPPYPRFVKPYADLRTAVREAARAYAREVRTGKYPDAPHSYS
jgi:3-methyl-2-oxobutanoate hydroxymethyltransferase